MLKYTIKRLLQMVLVLLMVRDADFIHAADMQRRFAPERNLNCERVKMGHRLRAIPQ